MDEIVRVVGLSDAASEIPGKSWGLEPVNRFEKGRLFSTWLERHWQKRERWVRLQREPAGRRLGHDSTWGRQASSPDIGADEMLGMPRQAAAHLSGAGRAVRLSDPGRMILRGCCQLYRPAIRNMSGIAGARKYPFLRSISPGALWCETRLI